jgi:hypothetical protein
VREIRTLRAMWRALETGTRQLLNGHEGGNPGYKPRMSLRANAPVLDPTRHSVRGWVHRRRSEAGSNVCACQGGIGRLRYRVPSQRSQALATDFFVP